MKIKFLIGLVLFGYGVMAPVFVGAEEPASRPLDALPLEQEDAAKSLDVAKRRFMEAMEALGRAGKLTYDQHVPDIQEKTQGVLTESQRLLEQWKELIQKELGEQKEQGEKEEKDRKSERMPYI